MLPIIRSRLLSLNKDDSKTETTSNVLVLSTMFGSQSAPEAIINSRIDFHK